MTSPDLCLSEDFSEKSYVEQQDGVCVDLLTYWEQFEDPILNALVEKALRQNYDLNVAREKICQARGEFGIEFANLFPFVDHNTSFFRERNPDTEAISPFLGGNFVNFYRMGFDCAWEIDLFGKLRSKAKAAAMNVFAQQEEVRDVNLSVSSEVATLYFEIRNVQERIEITNWHINSTQELIEISQARFEGGFASELDLLTARALNDTRKAELQELESDLQQTIYALAVLLGEIPECFYDAFQDAVPVPDSTGKIPLGIPSELLCRRGDVRSAYFSMISAGAEVIAARQELFPQLTLTSLYEFATSFFSLWFDGISNNWDYQFLLTIPAFRGGQLISNIKVKTSIQRQRVMEYEKQVITALAEVERALVSYFKEEKRFEELTNEKNNYREAREIAVELYKAGLQDFVFVFNIEQNLYASELRWSVSRELVSTYLVSVYKALGGGWEC